MRNVNYLITSNMLLNKWTEAFCWQVTGSTQLGSVIGLYSSSPESISQARLLISTEIKARGVTAVPELALQKRVGRAVNGLNKDALTASISFKF